MSGRVGEFPYGSMARHAPVKGAFVCAHGEVIVAAVAEYLICPRRRSRRLFSAETPIGLHKGCILLTVASRLIR
jgi:hypothetical protein